MEASAMSPLTHNQLDWYPTNCIKFRLDDEIIVATRKDNMWLLSTYDLAQNLKTKVTVDGQTLSAVIATMILGDDVNPAQMDIAQALYKDSPVRPIP